MPFVKVGSVSELPAGSLMEAALGDERYAVCNVGGEIHVLGGVCPHQGGPLGQGALNGSNITCPWHAWEFDCRSGAHDYNPAVRVATYPVRIADGEILIDIP